MIIVCMYVDDEAVAENWPSKFNTLMQFLQKKIEVTHEGSLHWYLSVRWRFNVDTSAIMATQTAYIEKAAVALGIDPNLKKGPKMQMDDRFTVNESDVPAEEDVDPALRTEVKSIL
eukprot:3640599-Rhodomonas_salina.1